MFSSQEVQARLRQTPFQPLQIVTTTGETYDIPNPDMAFVGASWVEVGRPSKAHPEFPELTTKISLFHVTELRDLPSPAKPTANGPTAS